MEHTRKERGGRTLPTRLRFLPVSALALALLLVAGWPNSRTDYRLTAHAETASCTITPDTPHTDAVDAVAGTTISLRVAQQGADLQPGGTWEAQLGSFNTAGDYTAPSYIPPYGVDEILYHSPDGRTARLTVRVIPDPSLPQTGQPLYQVVTADFLHLPPDPYASPTPTPAPTPPTYDTSAASADSESFYASDAAASDAVAVEPEPQPFGTPDSAKPLVVSSDQYAQPALVYDCVEVDPVELTATDALYEMPAEQDGTPVSGIRLLQASSKQKPKKCKAGPYNPPPPYCGTGCTGGTRVVNGPVKTFQRFGPVVNMGSIKVTAEISAQLAGMGFKGVAEGTYNITGQYIYYGAAYTRDVYGCVNGQWKFLYREACEAKAVGLITAPPWAAALWGYARNGGPGQWSPWMCHKTH